MNPCSNTQHAAPATLELMGRPLCESCARTVGLGVPSVPRADDPLADELLEHVRAAFPVRT